MDRLRNSLLLVFLGVFFAAGQVLAHTATQFFKVEVTGLPDKGSVRNMSGTLLLQNLFKEEAFVVTLQYPVERGDKRVRTGKPVKVGPGRETKIPFKIPPLKSGKQRVILDLVVQSDKGAFLGTQHVDLYFMVEGDTYGRSTYEKLYLPGLQEEKGMKPVRLVETATAPPGARVVPLPEHVRGVLGKRTLKAHELPKPAGSGTGKTVPGGIRPVDPGTVRPKPPGGILGPQSRGGAPAIDAAATGADNGAGIGERLGRLFLPISDSEAATTYTVSGTFSYRGLDNQLHPGWNWYVQLLWKKPNNDWVELATAYIPPSGNWSLAFSKSGYTGQNLRIRYRAGSYYIMPQDEDGNEFWWKDPDQNNISTSFNIGHRVANTSNSGTLAGLGDVHNSAYLFWWKFYSNNLNPERDQAIKLYFPNTWYDCGDGSGNPWSCASLDGKIWLIAAHTDNFTVQHELAHQLNNEYWNNERPPGAGGSHVLSNCYNTGLALREGFANAAPHWVLDGENASNPSAGGFQLESPDKATICNGDTNETWVAGTFWDLLDRHGDDKDILWFNNAAEVFSIYLNKGVKNGMKNYRQDYRDAASSGHQTYIDDIYKNNTITVP